jgi:hypothetical protein
MEEITLLGNFSAGRHSRTRRQLPSGGGRFLLPVGDFYNAHVYMHIRFHPSARMTVHTRLGLGTGTVLGGIFDLPCNG